MALSNVNGNGVKEVRVGEASRTLARGHSDSGQLEAAVDKLAREREVLAAEKRDLEARKITLDGEVRGRRLQPQRYRDLCGEQTAIKLRIKAIDDRLCQIRTELTPLLDARREAGISANAADQLHMRLRILTDEVREIKRMLTEVLGRPRQS